MAANDKTARVSGFLRISPSSVASPLENIAIDLYTNTFQIVQKLTFTLAAGATKTITFSVLGIANNAHLIYVKARDITTGLPRCVELTFTAAVSGEGGISAVSPSALVVSDLVSVAYDIQDNTALAIQAQSSGNDTQVTVLVAGD